MTARRLYVPAAMPSRNANGRAVPAKLRFYTPDSAYDALATVYTDDTLTIAHAQPVLSNAFGHFPEIWADSTDTFDVVYSDQAFDETLGSYTNVSPLTDAAAASVALAESAADDAEDAQAAAEAARDVALAAAGETLDTVDPAALLTAGAAAGLARQGSFGSMVRMVAAAGTGDWTVYKPDGTTLDTTGTTTDGFQEALTYAFGAGLPLYVYGVGEYTSVAQPSYINCSTSVNVPACQIATVRLHNVTLNFNAMGSSSGLIFDSFMMMDWEHTGQVVYSGNAAAIHFKPTNPVPLDQITVCVASRFKLNSVATIGGTNPTGIRFDLSGGSILDNSFRVAEVLGANGLTVYGQHGIQVTGPTVTTVFECNTIDIGGTIHMWSTAGIQVGLNTTNQGNLRRNIWRIGSIKPKGASSVGFNSFGSNDQVSIGSITNQEGTLDKGVALQSGATENLIHVGKISGFATTSLEDSGTNNNYYYGGSLNLASIVNRRTAPASAAAAGTTGEIATDTGYIYVCTATNTWKRVAIATW